MSWFPVPAVLDATELSSNPKALDLIESNLDKVNWDKLSGNPSAIHILEQNLDKVNWDYLSGNPSAIHILEKNLEEKMNRLMIVDAHNQFVRGYIVDPSKNPNGQPIGGSKGFLKILNNISQTI